MDINYRGYDRYGMSNDALYQRYLLERIKGIWVAVSVAGAILFGVFGFIGTFIWFADVNGPSIGLIGSFAVVSIVGFVLMIFGGVKCSSVARDSGLHRRIPAKPVVKEIPAAVKEEPFAVQTSVATDKLATEQPDRKVVEFKRPKHTLKDVIGNGNLKKFFVRKLIPGLKKSDKGSLVAQLKAILWPWKKKAVAKPVEDAVGSESGITKPAEADVFADFGPRTVSVGTGFQGLEPDDVSASTGDRVEDLDAEIARRAERMKRDGVPVGSSVKRRKPLITSAPTGSGDSSGLKLTPESVKVGAAK